MKPLSLGFSPCPNDTFVFHALVHELVAGAPPVEVTYADIDELNSLAAAAALDIVKVSYAALPWLLDDYALLPSGGALGRGCGPLVLTRPGPLAEPSLAPASLTGATVAVPGLRTTAYLLFRLWSAARGVARIEVRPFDQIMPAVRDGSVDAGLVIHESRFTYPSYGLVSVADLGDWWERETGLPIPLGAILVRRSLGVETITRVAQAVRESVEQAWAAPERSRAYVLEHSQELAPEVVDQHIALYVNELTRDLGAEGYAAVEALLTRAAAAGLTPPVASLL